MRIADKLKSIRFTPSTRSHSRNRRTASSVIAVLGLVLVALLFLGWYWSRTPPLFDVAAEARQRAGKDALVTGYVTSATLARVVETLLEKPGGYLSNDVAPPSVFLDNMPNWEYGVLTQSRDLARALRNDFARSRSQSMEDADLVQVEPNLNANNDRWLLPSSENEYSEALTALDSYLKRLNDANSQDAQFFARADNLADWLSTISKRLGSLSQRLSTSAGQYRFNTDLGGDAAGRRPAAAPSEIYVRTTWTNVDDIFFEARGSTWALIHFLRAVEVDFQDVLKDKNAVVSLRQIIRELEATQRPIGSPIILNGSGYGVFANHSLTIAAYIARANAALIDLRNLLSQG